MVFLSEKFVSIELIDNGTVKQIRHLKKINIISIKEYKKHQDRKIALTRVKIEYSIQPQIHLDRSEEIADPTVVLQFPIVQSANHV